MARTLTPEQRRKKAYAAVRRLTTASTTRRPYYAARRVPHTFRPAYLRRKLLPLVPLGAAAVGTTIAAMLPVGQERRDLAWNTSEELSNKLSQRSQRLFFDNPGLDTLLVRALGTHARRLTRAGSVYLSARIALGLDPDGRATTMRSLIPTHGYDALMVTMLVVGTALGYLRGGKAHASLVYDTGDPQSPWQPARPHQRRAKPRRLKPPRTLTDTAADIDDLYWANGHGQCVKITAVGEGERRRWIVSLPGTAHVDPASTPNPADFEANVREALNLPSSMRVGVIRAIHDAMRRAGVADHNSENILMVGHSQGGMVATALAAQSPEESGLTVQGVIGMGTPSRRMRIRPDVTMLAIAHDQDVVPSVDGASERSIDHRVTVHRTLNRPRSSPLYYAHASMTYTQTLRDVERRAHINQHGTVGQAVHALQHYLPDEGEKTRVFIYDVWQDLLEPTDERTWNTVAALDEWTWQPVSHDTDWKPQPLIPYDLLQRSVNDLRKWWNNDESTSSHA